MCVTECTHVIIVCEYTLGVLYVIGGRQQEVG